MVANLMTDRTHPGTIRALDFKVIHFFDKRFATPDGQHGREVVVLYALGEDGVVREFTNGKWTPLPITELP